jgi:putative membrane protein
MTSEEMSDSKLGSGRRGFVRWIVGGILILLLIGVFVVPFVFFGGFERGYPGPGPYYGGPYFFFPFGFFIFIFIVFFAVRWIFWGWGWGWRRGRYQGRWGYGYGGDATEILRLRYARGEITKEQFDQMKKDLDEQS